MIASRTVAKTLLERALTAGARFGTYEPRAYQITAALRCEKELVAGKHAVLTLPTGTGKTVICGMVAALFLHERPGAVIAFTAPRRTLLSQLHERSRWLNPTASVRAVGLDPKEDDRHVRGSFAYARMVFGMPEFLANRFDAGAVPPERVADIELLIIDEFDAFLVLRYLARSVAVTFSDALERLLSALPPTCRLLLVSATTPEIPHIADRTVDSRMELDQQFAFRRFLDESLDPAYVSVAERYYRDFVPHARIVTVLVVDRTVQNLDRAIDSEVSLLINQISGEVGYHIDPAYVLPRLTQIRAGRLALSPGRSKLETKRSTAAALLGRLQKMSHLPDFLYEDMAKGYGWNEVMTYRFDGELRERTVPVVALRVSEPERVDEQIQMLPEPHGKLGALCAILAEHPAERGVLFFRNVRILDVIAEQLRSDGHAVFVVHGKRTWAENEDALRQFRATDNTLLLITRDTGKRGLDLPEADFAIFYSPKAREDVTWQEVSRIRSTLRDRKTTYMLCYAGTGEQAKMASMIEALRRTARSVESSSRQITTAR